MKELDHIPETSIEKDVLCEDEDSFCLSRENITSLKLLICQVGVTECLCDPARNVNERDLVPAEAAALKDFILLILQLEARKTENEALCESHREKIQQLWDRLQVAQEEREAFNEHMVSSKKSNLEAVSF